jgi:hypothetical protein
VCTTAYFVTVQEHFIASCRSKEVVQLFRVLLSLFSIEMGSHKNVCITLEGNVIMQFENHWIKLFCWYNYWIGMLKNYTHSSLLKQLKMA